MSGEDDDLKLQRASSALLAELEKLLPNLVRGRQHGSAAAPVRQFVREVDLYRACALVRYLAFFNRTVINPDLDRTLSGGSSAS
jgi:hypothetical protein